MQLLLQDNLKRIHLAAVALIAAAIVLSAGANYVRYVWVPSINNWDSGTTVVSNTWEGDIYFNNGEVVQNNLVRMQPQ